MLEPRTQTATPAYSLTRTDRVRLEGREAARHGLPPHVNPYRSRSADGVAWREGYDAMEASATA